MANKKRKSNNYTSPKKIIAVIITTIIVGLGGAISLDIPGLDLSWDKVFGVVDSFLTAPEDKPVISFAEGELAVTLIDVGQGDSILIQSPEQNMLIDAGENDKGDEVVDFLKKSGVTSLDMAVCTHYHSDHVGGMDYVLDNIPTKTVILPDVADKNIPTTKTVKSLFTSIKKANAKAIIPEPLQTFSLGGGATITILGIGEQYDNTNNTSVVVRLDFGETSFLFTGDAEKEVEADLLEACRSYLDVDVFKAGHHGSTTSNTSDFIKAVSPDFVGISCGFNNSYGHPHKEILQLLDKNNIQYNRTDIDGSITYISDGNTITVKTER